MSDWKELLKEAKELFDSGLVDEDTYKTLMAEAMALRKQSITSPPRTTGGGMTDTFAGGSTRFGGTTGGGVSDTFMGGQTRFQAVGQTIGSYRVLGELGSGGMGAVYRARHTVEEYAQQTGDVVIKLMHPQYAQDPSFRSRFISEAAMGRNIQHPNIVRIHDVIDDQSRGILAIVMDLAEGRPLEDMIPSQGMALEQALPIIKQLCEAIDHIHEQGIVHRDLKPENIIVSSSGKVTILDMGIAKDTKSEDMSKTSTGMAMGTPLYMAPEQLDAKNATSAVDRYALGLIVYTMLSGGFPWAPSEGAGEILSRKFSGNLLPLKGENYVKSAVMRLLSARSADRWEDCASFLSALQEKTEEKKASPKQEPSSTREAELLAQIRAEEKEKLRLEKLREQERQRLLQEEAERTKEEAAKREAERRRKEAEKRRVENERQKREKAESEAKEREEVRRQQELARKKRVERQQKILSQPPYILQRKLEKIEKIGGFLGFGSSEKRTLVTVEYPMKLIPAGAFMMGALPDDGYAGDDEKPRHKVEITKDFYVGKYPVTQKLWKAVMGDNPSYFKGEDRPVEKVSWFDCVQFCNKLSEKEGREPVYTINGENVSCNWNANGYRLLSEAEWEYCARANQNFLYSGSNNPDEVAWYSKNSGEQTHPVGQKKPNGFGLHDMSGNVWEWCWDWFGDYSAENQSNPTGAPTGSDRVGRGGSWDVAPWALRVSLRGRSDPTDRGRYLGFRLGLHR